MLYLIKINPDLKTEIETLLKSKNVLGWTVIFMLIAMFSYSFIELWFFYNDFWNDATNETNCSTSIHCFLSVLKYGLSNGGGVG